MEYTEKQIRDGIKFALDELKDSGWFNGNDDDKLYKIIADKYVKSLEWNVKEIVEESIQKLILNDRIENVSEGESHGMLICYVKYLKDNKAFTDAVEIHIDELPKGKYNYVLFSVENGFHKKLAIDDSYFFKLKTILDVEKFLQDYYTEFKPLEDQDFYGHTKESKKFH